MTVKYKVSDFAKDLNLSAKKVLDELNAMGSTGKKNSSNLEENELNYLLEKFSKDSSVTDLNEFLNSAKAPKEEPKPAEKKAEKKTEKKPEAPKAEEKPAQKPAEKKPEQKAQPAAQQNQQAKAGSKHGDKKNEQHKKREEKTVSLSELARETGAKASTAPAQAVSVRREDNQVTVDTRTVDMNVDRFDARYDDLASTKNTENRRKPTPQGNKQKFTQRGQRQRQQFQKGKRETEFERLQRIQLEKARSAQLKVMIPDEITVGELAARLKQQAGKVIAKFMQMGEMHAINDVIDFDTASLLAEEFHAKVELRDGGGFCPGPSALGPVLPGYRRRLAWAGPPPGLCGGPSRPGRPGLLGPGDKKRDVPLFGRFGPGQSRDLPGQKRDRSGAWLSVPPVYRPGDSGADLDQH